MPWDAVKVELLRLIDESPGALLSHPEPRIDDQRLPPFHIFLAGWATREAQQLHERFGGSVQLTVGAMSYPHATPPRAPLLPPIDAGLGRLAVSFDSPVMVRSGYSAQVSVELHNLTEEALTILNPSTWIINPETDQVVGYFSGIRAAVAYSYDVQSKAFVSASILIGTDSVVPELGWAVPPGSWAVRIVIGLGDRGIACPPPLPITVTE